MTQASAKIRLFVDAPLSDGSEVALDRAQSNYLFAVMRLSTGDGVLIFNGRDGEWLAEVAQANKKAGVLVARTRTRAQTFPPDLWLCFAPIKKARTDFIAEKACEMGCAALLPVFTEHTNSERVNVERLRAHGTEAAEQCGMLSIPEVHPPRNLTDVLASWPEDRNIMFCDESGTGPAAVRSLSNAPAGPWAILIGPEGGFSATERARLGEMKNAHPVSLGPRILRADTAAVAALALFQATKGDWM